MKCSDCRKLDAVETYPEKIASWLVRHFFADTLQDHKNNSQLKGFGEGYEIGRNHQRELQNEKPL